jgi:hypothetical protein
MITKGFGLWKKSWDAIVTILIVTGLVGLIAYALWNIQNRTTIANTKRMEVVCPSFLSIARSARDTLIVMRNEPLCNRYVLDNLQ